MAMNEWSVIRIEFATSPPQIRPVEVPNEMCIEMSCEYNIYVKCVGRSAKTTHKGSDSHLLHGNIICVVFWDGLWTAGSAFFLRVETCEKKRRPLGFEKWQGSFNGYHVPVMGIHLPAVAGQQSVWPRLESPSSQVRICSFDISHLPASKSQVSRNLRNFLPKSFIVSKFPNMLQKTSEMPSRGVWPQQRQLVALRISPSQVVDVGWWRPNNTHPQSLSRWVIRFPTSFFGFQKVLPGL